VRLIGYESPKYICILIRPGTATICEIHEIPLLLNVRESLTQLLSFLLGHIWN